MHSIGQKNSIYQGKTITLEYSMILESYFNFKIFFFYSSINKKNEIRVFEYNDIVGEVKEIEINDTNLPLCQLLEQDFILLFIDPKRKRVWKWIGGNCSVEMKFMATQASYHIRDRYAFCFKITIVDEGNETLEFKISIGLEEEDEDIYKEMEPEYKGKVEQDELIEFMTEEQILMKFLFKYYLIYRMKSRI